jgi:L-ascorbate metabolism protein UlaG (beta-lactamase superfamily)
MRERIRRVRSWLRTPWGRRLLGTALTLLAVLLIVCLVALLQAWEALGTAPEGDRLARMKRSPQWQDGAFDNPEPLWNDYWGMMTELTSVSPHVEPDDPIPVVQTDPEALLIEPESGLRVTWLGHSTTLIEIDGIRVLTDPVWGERTSPLSWTGPERWYAPPLTIADLPPIDAVLISHDHYDHLDLQSIQALDDGQRLFIAPLGVGAHLEYWGVSAEQIVELDWWETHVLGAVTLTCTPARHASGRMMLDFNRTLWSSYVLSGPEHDVFFSGDTGLFTDMTRIGDELGPFDLALIEVGAYGQSWPDWHIGPEQAIEAMQMLQAKRLLPIHWGLFSLAYHGWTEPIERVLVAAEPVGIPVFTPRPGQTLEPLIETATEAWWPDIPWQTAEEYPIVSTDVEGRP